jgi:hypothetical protein
MPVAIHAYTAALLQTFRDSVPQPQADEQSEDLDETVVLKPVVA